MSIRGTPLPARPDTPNVGILVCVRSPFPTRYVDRDSQSQVFPHHFFVLRPPSQGAFHRDYVETSTDLRSGLEAKTLSDQIPHTSGEGQELTLGYLKDIVEDTFSANPIEWIRGCDAVTVIHHPQKLARLVSMTSRLLISPSNSKRMLSIVHQGEAFVFEIRLSVNRFIPPTSLVVMLNNPSDPAAEFVVQADWNEGLTVNELHSTKKRSEDFAMASLCRHITSYQQILYEDLKVKHEPVANSFPDFELCIGEEKWGVEVTRIESGMISYIDMSKTIERRTIDHFSTNRVTVDAVARAVQKALRAKARRRARCSRYSRCVGRGRRGGRRRGS